MNLVAPHVKDKWRVVGLELGIETAELNGISAPDDTKFLKCYEQIFDTWKRRAKPEYPFTWSFLISVLGSEAVQRKDIANELEKKLGRQYKSCLLSLTTPDHYDMMLILSVCPSCWYVTVQWLQCTVWGNIFCFLLMSQGYITFIHPGVRLISFSYCAPELTAHICLSCIVRSEVSFFYNF